MASTFAPINRKQFWWRVLAWVLLQVAANVFASFVPLPGSVIGGFNIGVTAWLAIFIGARLLDAGYRAWIGPVVVVAICLVLPIVSILIATILLKMGPHDALAALPFAVVAVLLALLGFIVWVGTRPSDARPNNWNDQFADEPDDRQRTQRVEPRF
jgi:uncharacterized membrane protein YhaH (DUF805 family)